MPKYEDSQNEFKEILQMASEARLEAKEAIELLKQEMGLDVIDKAHTAIKRQEIALNSDKTAPAEEAAEQKLKLKEELQALEVRREAILGNKENPFANDLNKLTDLQTKQRLLSVAFEGSQQLLTNAENVMSKMESNQKNKSIFKRVADTFKKPANSEVVEAINFFKVSRDEYRAAFDKDKGPLKEAINQVKEFASTVKGRIATQAYSSDNALEAPVGISTARHANVSTATLQNYKELCQKDEQKATSTMRAGK